MRALIAEYKIKAEQGDSIAQFNLGLMYHNGNGVHQDYKLAIFWYEKAAELWNQKAQNSLGMMYTKGDGVPIDYKQAYIWFSLASANDNKAAQGNRDFVARKLDIKTLRVATKEAQALFAQ